MIHSSFHAPIVSLPLLLLVRLVTLMHTSPSHQTIPLLVSSFHAVHLLLLFTVTSMLVPVMRFRGYFHP